MLRSSLAVLLVLTTAGGVAAQTETVGHPTGLWVFEGTTCADEKLTGLRIEEDGIVLYDPMRVSFTAVFGDVSDEEKEAAANSFVDNSVLPGKIDLVEARDGGHFFKVTDDLGEEIEFLIRVNEDRTGTIDLNGDFPMTVPLLPCTDDDIPPASQS